ncbi:MAG: TonB-dependent receptor plug domain-containing protein, partial [Alphaproteobacteria bacterium]|nr:TonB-dependent receptor plug domain-containing protein [Alphaproteobacteria bacterium]
MRVLKRVGVLSVFASLGAIGAPERASAAEFSDDGSFVVAQLDTITVSATRNPMAAFDYPGQVSVIDREIIEDISPSSLSDVFQAIPGAEFSGGPRRSGEVPTIRGLSGQGVLVLFDGARQSFLSGHDGRFFIDPEIVQAVEVLRGPASALYGSGALGGVISIRTMTAQDVLEPGERMAGKLSGGFQSVNDEWRGTAMGAWRSENGKIDLIGSGTYRSSGDIALGSGLALPADDEIVSSLLKGTFQPADDLRIALSWQRYGGNSLDPNNPQGATLPEPG